MEGLTELSELPATAIAILGAALAAQLALQAAAIVELWRRPAVMIGRRWVWVGVVLLGGWIGLYFYGMIGRIPEPVASGDRSSGVDLGPAAVEAPIH